LISVKNISKTYSNGVVAIKNISFDLEPSCITGYIGINGAGKSTTMKILCGMLPFDSGEVKVGDYSLPEDSLRVKEITGFVPESPELFNSLSVKEFFDFIKDIRNIKQEIFAHRLDYFAELFDFKEYISLPIGKLSKGNKQKVLIVSSIIHNPDVILLDEPLNGLDAFTILTFQDMVSKLSKKGKTVFYCSHLLDIMEKVSDRIIILDKGEIRINESKSEMKNSSDFKSLESLFKKFKEDNSQKEFSYDEVFS
jgi:ABC-2 type transport system ATP-binding protein